ncbi:MAG: arginine--tRNA ligase, partial [Phycisphaerales bacterium]
VVDLCGVNLAKQMHVGHLRSTVIGDALARVFARLGHDVKRQNHLGDWGLPIAMVVNAVRFAVERNALDLGALTLDDLDRIYRAAQRECDADRKGLAAVERFGLGPKAEAELQEQVRGADEAIARAKHTLVALQSGDPATVRLWERIAGVTLDECLAVCARLHADVRPEHTAGESSYRDELADIVQDLESRGVAVESDGALVVPLKDEGIEQPLLVRKGDGGFLYATTDLAGIRRRVQTLGADRAVYAVDARQSLHFKQVFAAATKAGYARTRRGEDAALVHAAFGTILGEDNRPFKTRSGENVRLSALLDEAVERALAAVRERNPDLPEPEKRAIAESVGVAAIKYADLSGDRVKDYVFNFDRMLAFEGDTGPYLLYALVRTRSISRKAQERFGDADTAAAAPFIVEAPEEKTLALALLRYRGALNAVAESCEPHRLCAYAYDLANAFSAFFAACPVLQAPDEGARLARLRLCALTARTLEDALHTLGLPTLERM